MSALLCKEQSRRHAVRKAGLNGLDFVEVDPEDRRRLTAWFLGKAPDGAIRPENVVILGGLGVRGIRVLDVKIRRHDESEDDCTIVTVDRPGDLSTYRLCLREFDDSGRPTEEPLQGFDSRYACVEFRFDTDCPSELDCKHEPVCPPEPSEPPELHYLAKDYAGFRQLVLDRLSLIMPDWQERHVPDLGVTLVEILAYVGDHLSYYQDAVATEAYLDTARQRISVRRHARLVDYAMHEGCNARAWLVLETSQAALSLDPDTFWFRTGSGEAAPSMLRGGDLASADPGDPAPVFEPIVEPGQKEIVLRSSRNEIRIYTWNDAECCLPRGTTCADLLDPGDAPGPSPPSGDRPRQDSPEHETVSPKQELPPPPSRRHVLDLHPCNVLVFEEVKGPRTGDLADADPEHRHAVRLTRADPVEDPLTGRLIWHVEWGPEDALPFPVCVSSTAPAPECEPIRDVTVVRGNVVLVDHGARSEGDLDPVPCLTRTPPCCDACEPPEVSVEAGPFEPTLDRPGLTYREPPAPCRRPPSCGVERVASAASSLRQDPRRARPQVALDGIQAGPECPAPFGHEDVRDPTRLARTLGPDAAEPARCLRDMLRPVTRAALDAWLSGEAAPLPSDLALALREDLSRLVERWEPAAHLLDCGPDDRHFVVEMDDERRAHIRFGEGAFGCRPRAGTSFRAFYRLGNGSIGNVGAESIRQIVFRTDFPSGAGIEVRNPLPAVGGTDPEPVGEVKAFAPHTLRRVLERAVTPDDYARIAMRDFGAHVQRAAGTLRWTGSHAEVLVAIDPRDAGAGDETLLCEIERRLDLYRRIGHDVEVMWARYVSIDLALTICVRRGYLWGHVKAALLEALGSRRRRDGGLGFFHADALSFGEGVQASAIVATAQAVEGVESVRIDRFERLYEGPNGEIEEGVLRLGPLEVARLENDSNRPEHGRLELSLGWGR